MSETISQTYPAAPRGDDVEVAAGLEFPDPFHALEDSSDPAVTAWQDAQTKLVEEFVDSVPGVDTLRGYVARCSEGHSNPFEPPNPPVAGGVNWFWTDHAPGATQSHVVVADSPAAEGRVVFDPADHPDDQGRIPFVSWLTPSPDGKLLAVGVCYDGSEANWVRFVEVESGRVLDDRPAQLMMDNYTGGGQWLPDSSGLLYSALVGPKSEFTIRIFRHDLGQPARTEPEDVPFPTRPPDYVGVYVSRDGRFAVACQTVLTPTPVAILDLRNGEWKPFLTDVSLSVTGHFVGDEYVGVTTHEAPRGRVVAVPVDAENPSDPVGWRVVVPESDAVLRSVTPVGDVLYVNELVDTYANVRIFDVDGSQTGEVPLPGKGAVSEPFTPMMSMGTRGHPDEFVFNFSTLTESWATYRHRPGESEVELLQAPKVCLDAVVDDLWATAPDGSHVPYHVIHRPGVSAGEPRPTLINGYGGFNVPWLPLFTGAMSAWVEAGGVLVHAHLRGGSELGQEWWEQGRWDRKQNTFDDLYAIAEDLIARGWTEKGKVAVTGDSNGGLLSAVAAVQRPDLWGATVPRVPIVDLIGALRDAYGYMAISLEWADPTSADGVRYLASFSPYHRIEDGTAYPAVYVEGGETDPRCPPWHARKLVARLQEATTSDKPVLLKVWKNTGHGSATAKDVEVEQHTTYLAFLARHLGLSLE
jgi:prolyl oligopeptidase